MASLRERRVKFTKLIIAQVAWMNAQPGWQVALDECRVISPRPIWVDGKKIQGPDAVHKLGSFHHDGLASDLVLYVNGLWVSDGSRPEWQQAGAHWKGLDPDCTWGGDFPTPDPNHFSTLER